MDTINQASQSNEQLVQAMRAHWLKEAALLVEHSLLESKKEKERGDSLFLTLMSQNRPLLAKYARGYFDRDVSLVTDGVQELVVALYAELRSLSDNIHSRLWGDRFLFCLKMLAHALFTRRLRRQYGKARPPKDPDDPEAERPYYEQLQSGRGAGTDEIDLLQFAPDPTASDAVPGFLQTEELRALLNAIPNPTHREALCLSCRGWKQERIAAHQGCSVRTVFNRIGSATAYAAAWARERYRSHGEFSDWISGR